MTKVCVICKKEPIPYDRSRSFHKFPKDDVMKQKWIIVTGKTSISANSCVCSDHFTNESYHQTDGYTTLRRLLSNAVPNIIKNPKVPVDDTITVAESTNKNCIYIKSEDGTGYTEVLGDITPSSMNEGNINSKSIERIKNPKVPVDDTITVTESTNKNYIYIKREDITEYTEELGDITPSSTNEGNINSKSIERINNSRIPVDITSTVPEPTNKNDINSQSGDSDINIEINNRKRPYPFRSKDLTNKKFRFKDGVQNECIERKDFVSDKAWERFLKLMIYKNNQVAVLRNRYLRRNKKIENLTTIIEKMKMEKGF